MIYEKIYKGREILFWSICSSRTLWLAVDNFLLIDGKLVARSGGMCFRGSAKAMLSNESTPIFVELKTKTSFFGVEYDLLVRNALIDSGILKPSFVWKEPLNIEQTILQLRCK